MTASGLVIARTAFGQGTRQESVSPWTTVRSHQTRLVRASARFAPTAPVRQHRTVVERMGTIRQERPPDHLRLALVRAGRVERTAVSLGSDGARG